MRDDLLHQVSGMRDVTNAILLTHNIDFVFLQSVAMSYLRRCGDPALTILADADCAADSYRTQCELLDGMGTRYRVVPIRMRPGFVFHPKALLLTGPQQATLYVGSGNLTFGGWRQNGEVWSRYTATEDGLAVFEEFRAYVAHLLSGVPLASAILSELEDAFDPKTKFWPGTAPAGEPTLLGRAGGEEALLDSLVVAIGSEPVDELVVCSPYFDVDGDALAALRARIPHENGLLLHPGRGSTLTPEAWARAGNGVTRRPCEIRHPHEMGDRPGFVHAKFYGAIRGDDAIVIQGSANCTRAALLMDGSRGNAELMTVVRTSAEAFRREWLETLPEVAGVELVPAEDILEDEAPRSPALQILAARAEDGVILVAYQPPAASIYACSIDGKRVAFTVLEPGQVHIRHFGAAPSLTLEGQVEGLPAVSPPHWVDQEHQLRATARRRRLEEAIPRTLGGTKWTSDQWMELLQVLGEHLKYTPIRAEGAAPPPRGHKAASAGTRRYEDLFAEEYSTDKLLAHWKDEMPLGAAHDSVRKLLMRWLGVGQDEMPASPPPDSPPAGATSQGEGDEPEGRPATALQGTTPHEPAELTRRMRDRLNRILADIEATVTAQAYMEARPLDFLRADLMMMSVILRFGHARGWLSNEAFFAFTHAVWAHLFLSSSNDAQMGWLEWRRSKTKDPAAFTAAMASPQLSAALIAWTLIGLDAPPSIERARFVLARALSAARLPELWFGGSAEDIAGELADVLRASQEPMDPRRLVSMWQDVLAQGEALRSLGELLEILGLDEARHSIDAPSIGAGELLWQGRAGYCITLEPGSRDATSTIKTLKLQLGGTGNFQGGMTLPVREILATNEIARAAGERHVAVLRQFLADLSSSIPSAAS